MRIILIVGVQTMHDLSRSLLSNTATKICARCGDSEDYAAMAHSMGLTNEQRAWLPLHLAPGLFVAKLTYGDNQHPFLLRIPFINVPQTVSDAEVEASGLRLRRALNWVEEVLPTPVPAVEAPETRPPGLTDDEERLHEEILADPYRPFSKLAPHLGISTRKAIALRKSLCEAGYATEWRIDSAHGGRQMLVLIPLLDPDNGDDSEDENTGRGGIRHHFAIDGIAEAHKADGWATHREVSYHVGGEMTFVDLVVRRAGEEIFVEFEQRPDYAVTNVRKDLAVGAQRVLIITATVRVQKSIRNALIGALSAAEMERVQFSLLSSFMKEG